MGGRRTLGALGSLALHGAVALALGLAFPAKLPPAPDARLGLAAVRGAADVLVRPMRARELRRRLVAEARARRSEGKLPLGVFVLAANKIDADEEGTPFDLGAAVERYHARVAELRAALKTDAPDKAVPRVFSDLRYAGLPGGRMGDLLLSGSGSCEPLSQLVAAALYDGGLGDGARLRYYGGLSAGVSHLAPVIVLAGVERDLTSGDPADAGGSSFAASELVDAYARAHGIDGNNGDAPPRSMPDAKDESTALFGTTPSTRTMTSGYPANDDRFEGALPLYSDRAVADRLENKKAIGASKSGPPARDGDSDVARTCSFMLRLGELDPPRAVALVGDGSEPVELTLHRVPSRDELNRTAGLVAEVEVERARITSDPIRSVVALGCLAGLYDRAGLEFSFAREPDVAKRAVLEARKVRAAGAAIIASQGLATDEGKAARQRLLEESSLGAWVLLYLDGGGDVVERLARETGEDSFATIGFVAALIVEPTTRSRGLAQAASLPLETQIAIMQELAHAQDNARPWSATYDPDLRVDGESDEVIAFARTYDVLRPIAWRLWEAPVDPGEAINAILRQSESVHLSDKTTRVLVAYYVQNEVWFYGRRDDGPKVLSELDAALRARGFPALLDFDEIKPLPADAASIRAALSTYARYH